MARQEYDRAIEQCKYVFDFDINNVAMHEIMQQAYKALNNYEELIMEYEEMTHMNPDNMQLRNMLLKLQKEQND
jgi:tetratricopeptide (TPR) repeat protein